MIARALALLLALASLPGVAGERVDAADYDAFWVWSGVRSQAVLAEARTLYILQGQIDGPRQPSDPQARFIAQGMAVPRLSRGEVWVVYRAHTLRWTEPVYATLLAQLERWRRAGNPVVGVQIDFDARTLHLDGYADFLEQLRQRLPRQYRLGITGLLDWGSNGDPAVLNRLGKVLDEVVVQTYQGRHSIPDNARYLPRVAKLQLPYRIGLVQGGEWEAPGYLEDSPWFRGYVVFLLNP